MWLTEQWRLLVAYLVPLLLGGAAVATLLPRPAKRGRVAAALAGFIALVWAGLVWIQTSGVWRADALFYLFSAVAVVSGVCMITNRNPVYAALWFALVTLSTCGLFLLSRAPFLAAATVIVYAGAIIVTFLFVIMLARQAGASIYDQRSSQPLLATVAAFSLLGGLLCTFEVWRAEGPWRPEPSQPVANQLSRLTPSTGSQPLAHRAADLGSVRGLGRSLFGDYLFAVELAGTLLMVAVIGAIIIAPRRSGGTL